MTEDYHLSRSEKRCVESSEETSTLKKGGRVSFKKHKHEKGLVYQRQQGPKKNNRGARGNYIPEWEEQPSTEPQEVRRHRVHWPILSKEPTERQRKKEKARNTEKKKLKTARENLSISISKRVLFIRKVHKRGKQGRKKGSRRRGGAKGMSEEKKRNRAAVSNVGGDAGLPRTEATLLTGLSKKRRESEAPRTQRVLRFAQQGGKTNARTLHMFIGRRFHNRREVRKQEARKKRNPNLPAQTMRKDRLGPRGSFLRMKKISGVTTILAGGGGGSVGLSQTLEKKKMKSDGGG